MFGYPAVGLQELVGAMDELDGLDHSAGGFGAYPAVGLRELVGADPSESDFLRLMASAGASDPSTLAKLAAKMRQVREVDPSAVVVRQVAEDVRRRYHMGFDSGATLVAALASGSVTQRPQVTMRIERIFVPSFIAPFFTIDNITVGKDSQNAVGINPVPAAMYSEVSVGSNLNLKTANLGHEVAISFTNVDAAAAHRFRAGMTGTVVDVG